MTIRKFSEHVRQCAQCNGVSEVELMCREGKTIVANLSYAGVRDLESSDAKLLVDAIDFIKANEWAGRTMVDGELVPTCPDCGAQKGQAHSVSCGCDALLVRGGKRP